MNIATAQKEGIVWYKGQEGLTMSDAELAYSSFDYAGPRVVKINRVELLKDGTIHPTQKPIKLYDWIYATMQKRRRFDFRYTLGSRVRIAADKAGLNFVGFEIDR